VLARGWDDFLSQRAAKNPNCPDTARMKWLAQFAPDPDMPEEPVKLEAKATSWFTRYAQEDAYAKAVEAGDTATMQRLVDEAAKKAGYNVGPVWHGTRNPFTQFDISRARSTGFSRIGFWFTDTPGAAAEYGTRAMKVFLDVREPRTFATWDDLAAFAREDDGEELRQRLLGENTDSVKIRGEVDGIEQNITAVLDPRQIKSADPVTRDDSGQVIPLSKRFDFSNPDIRY